LYVGESQTLPVGVLRLNSSGSVDGTFQALPISSQFNLASVFSLHVTQDGKIIAGGLFDNYGGVARNNLVRLQSNGAMDPTLNAGTDNAVTAVTSGGNGSILIGGNFENVNGSPRTSVARLLIDASGANNAPFDFDGDGKTDIGIFRPSGGEWWVNRSGDGQTFALQFGASTTR
jgi:hypothetical protein